MSEFNHQFEQVLLSHCDFLALTCQHPQSLPRFDFQLTSLKGDVTQVNIIDTGIIIFEPVNVTSNKDIIISSGIHGDETAPIEICNEFIRQLLVNEIVVAERVLFIFGNPEAINNGERFIEENLNRLFSGAHSLDGGLCSQERKRALLLENTVAKFFESSHNIEQPRVRLHYDLHTAIRKSKNNKFAICPFRHYQPYNTEQFNFLLACGIDTILLAQAPTTAFGYFSAHEFSSESMTIELGQVMPFGQNKMTEYEYFIQRFSQLITGVDLALPTYQEKNINLFEVAQIINRTGEQFSLHFADEIENFTDFPIGTLLASDGNKDFYTETLGEAVVFPNIDVAIGQRALMTVVPTTIT
jgi:succinylglutamate desuccinylase